MIGMRTIQKREMQDAMYGYNSLHPSPHHLFRLQILATCVCLLLACLGTTWFGYQLFLVPQQASFAPDWGDAQWITASDGTTPVTYFRQATNLSTLPDSAFVTVAASQMFRLYVNGTYVGTNYIDVIQGNLPRAYVYDVSSVLEQGTNVLALRVANLNEQAPQVRVSLGMTYGNGALYRSGSGAGWLATSNSALAHPRYAPKLLAWTQQAFDASTWHMARVSTGMSQKPMLTVNPQVYEQPLATQWFSAGYSPDAYFVRQVSIPLSAQQTWLRLAATGTSDVYINGTLFLSWNGQAVIKNVDLSTYLSTDDTSIPYRAGLALGVYNITPFLHPGVNTVAIHVLAPGISAAEVGLDTLSAAMSVDMLTTDWTGHGTWLNSTTGWHSATHPVDGWAQGDNNALNWPTPVQIGRPGAVHTFYIPEDVTPRNVSLFPLVPFLYVVIGSIALVLGLWLVSAFMVWKGCNKLDPYRNSLRRILATMSLAFLPALALESLLMALSREPQITQPFPYTWAWATALIALVIIGFTLLWANMSTRSHAFQERRGQPQGIAPTIHEGESSPSGYSRDNPLWLPWSLPVPMLSFLPVQMRSWIRKHWALLLIVAIAIPLSCYNIGYEPYWQDELSSFYASRGVLAHGLPFFPSGFLYEKAELYSYLLALWTTVFGAGGGVPRFISVFEYLISIPLLYIVGNYFFNKRVALLATTMLALSPITLIWSRQMRMYEQAQLLSLLTVYLFYRAIQERHRVRMVYFAAISLVVMYLSHEETFITLPAILLCILMASRDRFITSDGDERYGLPSVLTQKHWWFAACICVGSIVTQLLLVHFTTPPLLGTDQTQRPFVAFTINNIPYYFDLLFAPNVLGKGTCPWITLNSILCVVGCILARYRGDMRAKYCALFPVVSLVTLVLLFVSQADRYIYTLLPYYYLMGAFALVYILQAGWQFAQTCLVQRSHEQSTMAIHERNSLTLSTRILVMLTGCLVCATILIAPMLPISGYNLFASQLFGLSYHRHYADYDAAAQYMKQHWQPGDIVISVAPANCILYYTGHVDYFFSVDRALFLLEQNGHIIETASASHALLNQDDFQTVLSQKARIWILSDNGVYQAQDFKRFTFPPDFRLVFEGYGSAIYFRGD